MSQNDMSKMRGGDILFEDGKLRLEARLDRLEMTGVY